MNAKYLRAKKTASRMIRENGKKVKIKKQSPGVDKVTGKRVPGYDEPGYSEPGLVDGSGLMLQDAWVVFLPVGAKDTMLDQFKDNNGVLDLSRIKKVLISTEGLTWQPDSVTLVQYRDEWWKLYLSEELAPDEDVSIMYRGYIRRV